VATEDSGTNERTEGPLRYSPLHDRHVALGAKMVPFGGWEMPLAYPSGTVAEHRACREGAVVFDVSHLGTVRVGGAEAFDHLQHSLSNDLRRISPGRAQYTHLLDETGSVADDIIVWWVDEERFDVMPNASNTSRVVAAIGGSDVTAERAILAIQGPTARVLLATVAPEAAIVPRFAVSRFEWHGVSALVAGTGYTGEDGVECAVPAEAAAEFWAAIVAAGVTPAGLGARDTLRLEAGLPLHGHELGPGITPLQAELGWVVGWKKGDFIGRTALEEEKAAGPRRRLRGVVGEGRQPLRDGADVCVGARKVGRLTSGNYSPMRERGIGLALIDADAQLLDGDPVTVVQRGRALPAVVVRPPLWPPRVEE
jgi:aminomethyltransferase